MRNLKLVVNNISNNKDKEIFFCKKRTSNNFEFIWKNGF